MRLKTLEKIEWLVFILAGVVILRIPSLFEPYWYGDEAIYLTLGQAMRKGLTLYSQIHDNKPPFLYLIAAIAGGNQFWFKLAAMIWTLLTVTAFGKLAYLVFEGKKRAQIVTTGLFALLTTLPLLEGNIANAELFFILFPILATIILWKKELTFGKIFLAGVLLGMGGLFKMPVLFEAGVWPLVWLVTREKLWMKKCLLFASGVGLPIILSIIYFWVTGAGKEYIMAAWAQNLPYLSSWKAGGGGEGIYALKGRALVVIVLLAIALGLSRRIGRRGTILGVWWIIGLFAVLLSGRPYPHYLMQISGILALGLGIIKWGHKIEKFVVLGMIVLTLGSVYFFHFYSYPIVGYYSNFLQWVVGTKSQYQYFAWFDSQVPINYEVAKVIKAGSLERENIFVWGDNPVIYALAKRLPVGKYTVAYHIKELRKEVETINLLTANPPKFIVTSLPEKELPGLPAILFSRYSLEKEIGGLKIYRRFGLAAGYLGYN